ncbi:MAG: hypothetical protein ACLP5H_33505 [Desulfomonilaceae bacterium]
MLQRKSLAKGDEASTLGIVCLEFRIYSSLKAPVKSYRNISPGIYCHRY